MAVALQTHGIESRRTSSSKINTTYRSGGAGGRVSGVRSSRNSGHLKLVAGEVAARRPAATPAVYLRRRIVVASIFAALIGLGGGVAFGGHAAADHPTQSKLSAPTSIVAKPGDNLWSIARTLVPNGDITDLVDELVRLNGQSIEAGQTVRLPG